MGVGVGLKFYTGIYIEKSSFQKPNRPEKLSLVWKHPQVVNIQVCSNHDSLG